MTRTLPLDVPPPADTTAGRGLIRAHLVSGGGRVAILDDDPTGSQTVHGVGVVTVPEPDELAVALEKPGSAAFVLTNSRSLAEAAAVEVTGAVGRSLWELAEARSFPLHVVSRSDSTLRGHLLAEVSALAAAKRAATGIGYDGVLLAPAYFEAGRFTAGDTHWARVAGNVVPVGRTEFARDATFGYASSDLKAFLAEMSGGTVRAEEVVSISLEDIRLGGPDRVGEILQGVDDGAFVVVNGTEYSDYEIVVLGLHRAEAAGKSFLCRTGPSFVRALTGVGPSDPLTREAIWAGGSPDGHGLVVVGSHVGLTSRQVEVAQARTSLVNVELDVPTLADHQRRDAHIADVGRRVAKALGRSNVMLSTSRALVRGRDADTSLEIARDVSAAVVQAVRGALAGGPAWVIAKGGITSHDVAVDGLGIRRAQVLGQMLPGLVSVWEPLAAPDTTLGVPYVVFAGNVGDENTLADVIEELSGARRPQMRGT
jgi:uncharacterized protein YgbK (DUF1537 family)